MKESIKQHTEELAHSSFTHLHKHKVYTKKDNNESKNNKHSAKINISIQKQNLK